MRMYNLNPTTMNTELCHYLLVGLVGLIGGVGKNCWMGNVPGRAVPGKGDYWALEKCLILVDNTEQLISKNAEIHNVISVILV